MSQDIIREVTFFLHSIVMGIVITFVYDWFLILSVFYMLYRENNGVLRWFTVLGATLGMALYKMTVSKLFVHIMSTIIYKIVWCLIRIIQIIVKPLKWLFSIIKRIAIVLKNKLKKCQNFIKNKLTCFLKTLKMVLCKH